MYYVALRKKCPYLELFWSAFFMAFFRIRTEYGKSFKDALDFHELPSNLIYSVCKTSKFRISY